MRRRSLVTPAADSDSGMSLIELLVTMMLLGLILLMASSLFISVTQTTTHTQSVNEGTRIAANAMTETNRIVRFATDNPQVNDAPIPAFSFAGKSQLTIISLVDSNSADVVTDISMMPRMVSLSLDATGNLNEYRWKPKNVSNYWVFPAALISKADSSRVLGGKFLAQGTTTPLFRYFSDDWDSGTNDYVELTPSGNSSLSADDLAKIKFVEVTMNTVPLATPNDVPVIVTNRIGLLNLNPTVGGT